MTTYLLHYITFKQLPFVLLFFAVVFMIIAILLNKWREKNMAISVEKLKKDFLLFQKYLDRYYVTNIYYTSCLVIRYGIMLSGIFFIFRLSLIGSERYMTMTDINHSTGFMILWLIFIIIAVVLCIFFSYPRKKAKTFWHFIMIFIHSFLFWLLLLCVSLLQRKNRNNNNE